MSLDIDPDLKNIINQQISLQTRLPTEADIVPYSVLFSVDNQGMVSIASHEINHEKRIDYLVDILQKEVGLPNGLKFLWLLEDYANPKCYVNNTNFSVTYNKFDDQPFILIPNEHLLLGKVKALINSVTLLDQPFDLKKKQSIFCGTTNGPYDGSRSRYVSHAGDKDLHHVLLSNVFQMTMKQQLSYLFNINIDGNAMCYDRLYWQMSSESVPVYINRNPKFQQLHDMLLKPNVHYIDSTVDNWSEDFQDLISTEEKLEHCHKISKNGQVFINRHLSPDSRQISLEILNYSFRQMAIAQLNLGLGV
tara:strand:+ start:1243 stop:2160 length:918 start_codon:yes stop_codon:yes gene_type:complete